MRAGLLIRIRVTAAPRRATVVPIPTGRGLALLADVADRECRDGLSQPVIRRKHSVVAMPVLPRRRDQIGEPVQELKRREFDDAAGSWPRGLSAAARAYPVGGFVSGQHVADLSDAAGWAADHGGPTPGISFDPERIVRRQIAIHGVHNYLPEDLVTAVEHLASPAGGPLAALAGPVFPIERVNEAMALAATPDALRVIVTP